MKQKHNLTYFRRSKDTLSIRIIPLCIVVFLTAAVGLGQTSESTQKFVDENVKTGKITSLDLYGVWKYLNAGKIPFEAVNEQREYGIDNYTAWKQKVINLSSDFSSAYDFYSGACCDVKTGDLIVYQVPGRRQGGVLVVYKPKADLEIDAEVYQEFDKSTTRNANFPLSLYPKDDPKRYIRPGLYGLRFKEKKRGN